MRKRNALDAKYPNAPLTEVVCEVRFPGEIAVESRREVFWDKIRAQYPAVLVPSAQPGVAPAIQHYRYKRENGSLTVMVAVNSLALSETNYTTHVPLLNEYTRLHRLFSQCYRNVAKANRVGWRYVNLIPFVSEADSAPVRQYFRFGCNIAESLPPKFKNLQLHAEMPTKDGIAIIKLGTVQDKRDVTKQAFLLDLDYIVQGSDISFSEVPRLLAKARTANRQVFEDLITDHYRSYLRGEAI